MSPPLDYHDDDPAGGRRAPARIGTRVLVMAVLTVAVALAVLVAPRADPNPDGLEKVAAEQGLDTGVREHTWSDGPLADYGVVGVDNPTLGTGLAGLVGIAVTFVIGTVLVLVLPRARRRSPPDELPHPSV